LGAGELHINNSPFAKTIAAGNREPPANPDLAEPSKRRLRLRHFLKCAPEMRRARRSTKVRVPDRRPGVVIISGPGKMPLIMSLGMIGKP